MSASAEMSDQQVARILAMGLDEQARAAMPQDRQLALAIQLDAKSDFDHEGGEAVEIARDEASVD